MKSKKNKVLIAVIAFFAIVFLFACGYLIFRIVSDGFSQREYEQLASSYANGVSDTQDSTIAEITAPSEIKVEKVENPIDFDSLINKNPDIYSWIYIPNTNVNYPVCRHNTDDNFYLDHNIYKEYQFSGSIYSQFCNSRDYSDRVTVLYGHNMRDGSMFATLHRFADEDFFKKNKYMYVYTPERKLTYEIASAFVYDDRHIMNTFDFSNEQVFADYLNMIMNPRSVNRNVREGLTLNSDDKILVLSTCLNSGEGRYLVQGVLVKDEKTK